MMHGTGLLGSLLAGAWLAGAPSAAAAEPVRSLADLRLLEKRVGAVYDTAMPATVALEAQASGASGSGVVVSADGLILTAAHVVMGAEEVRVLFPDGKQFPGKVLGANFSNDSAMVRIVGEGRYPCVETGVSEQVEVGDWVVALGHSAGFDPARTPPLRFGRVVSTGPGDVLTTDCTLIGGDSGGPLFDLSGRMIAVHSSIGGALNNNNHSGIDGFRKNWERLLAGETWGRLSLNPLANPDAAVLGFVIGRGRGGVPVEEVVPGSPAARAGMRQGDRLVAIDGGRIDDGRQLQIVLARMEPGEEVELTVVRGRRELKMNAVLARRGDFFEEGQ